MVLGGRPPGRVGRRRNLSLEHPRSGGGVRRFRPSFSAAATCVSSIRWNGPLGLSALWPRRLPPLARRVPERVVRAPAADPRVVRPVVDPAARRAVGQVAPRVVGLDAVRPGDPRARVLALVGPVEPMVVATAGMTVVARGPRVVRRGRVGRHAPVNVTIAVRAVPVRAAVADVPVARVGTADPTAVPTVGPTVVPAGTAGPMDGRVATGVPMIVVARLRNGVRATKQSAARQR